MNLSKIKTTYKSTLKKIKKSYFFRLLVRIFSATRKFISLRRYSFILFLLSSILVAVFVFGSSQIYRQDKPLTEFQIIVFDKENKVSVSNVSVEIFYYGNGRDLVRLSTKLSGTFDGNEELMINPPENVEVNENFFSLASSVVNVNRNNYYYKLNDLSNPVVTAEYVGNVFGKNPQDLNLFFDLMVGNDQEGVLGVPVTVDIFELTDLTLSRIEPELDDTSVYSLEYTFLPDENPFPNYISLNAIDRKGLSVTQFNVFLLGIVIGVFLSISSAIFLDYVKFIEILNDAEE